MPAYRLIFIIACFAITQTCLAQGWIKRQDAPNALEFATSTSVLGKGYLTGGYGTALYQYDPSSFKWTQKATMPGSTRISAVGVTINDKFYAGLGCCNNYSSATYAGHRELYEYNPVTDAWTQKASFPGAARWLTGYFALNNKLYVTVGKCFTGSSCFMPWATETWQYDPATDAWTQKATFPGGAKEAPTFFVINGMGYITGGGGTSPYDTWQYNPNNDTWTQKASCPVLDLAGVAFTIGSYAYCLTSYLYGATTFLRYDPSNDSWTQLTNYPGVKRQISTAFAIGNRGFVTTGLTNPPAQTLRDLWEYNPNCPADIINDISVTNHQPLYCVDSLVLDSVKAYSVQHTGVNYTWLTSTDSISYQPLANSNVANLLNYGTKQTTWFKRVASLNSQCFDTSTAFKIKISNYIPPKIDTIVGPSVCEGDTVILQCMNPYSKFWQVNGSFTFDTGTIIRITTPGEYSVFVTNNAGCAGFSDTVTVSINALPQPQIHAWYDTLKSHVPWAQYRWYKNDTLVIGADSSYMLALVTGMYTLEAIDSNGCTGTAKLFYTPSSVNDLLPSEAMQIFPNPATDQFTILNNSAVPIDVSIYDMQGRMWKELKIDKGVKQFHIRTGGLPPGVYQVTAIVDGDMLHHKLVIR